MLSGVYAGAQANPTVFHSNPWEAGISLRDQDV